MKDMLENMILFEINDNYKNLTKTLVNQYINQIEIFDKDRIKVVYKDNKQWYNGFVQLTKISINHERGRSIHEKQYLLKFKILK